MICLRMWLLWVLVVITALITALVLLCIAWNAFQDNPTIVVTDSTHLPIWNYPFPAVTLCNFNKISRRRAFQMMKQLETTITDYRLPVNGSSLRLLSQLIFNSNNHVSIQEYTTLQDLLDLNEKSVDTALNELSPTCADMLVRCKWKGEEKICESMFEQIRTTEGFCCTFNYFGLKNHNFSGAQAYKAPTKPRRVSACGYHTALEVIVDSDPDDYFVSQIPSVGHRVLIHNPYSFPDWSSQSILVELKTLNLISISPVLTESTENIKSLPIQKRKCLFPHERYMHNSNGYSYHNCIMECKMNLTVQLCGCYPFYFYNEKGTYPGSRVCNLRDISCLKEKWHLIFTSVPGFNFKAVASDHVFGNENGVCDCLRDCDHVEYTAETSTGVLTRAYSTNQVNFYGGIVIKNQSVFRVYFDDLVGTKNRRDVSYSWHTLLAYYGGLLGLFVGFSFVSGVEIVYFFSVRLLTDLSSRNKKKKKKNKVQHSQNLTVQPIIYKNLDPSKLMETYEHTYVIRRSGSSSFYFIN